MSRLIANPGSYSPPQVHVVFSGMFWAGAGVVVLGLLVVTAALGVVVVVFGGRHRTLFLVVGIVIVGTGLATVSMNFPGSGPSRTARADYVHHFDAAAEAWLASNYGIHANAQTVQKLIHGQFTFEKTKQGEQQIILTHDADNHSVVLARGLGVITPS